MAIELRHLRYFLAVVDELHFGRAAERLHMAQPPLSRAIRQLEDALGVALLERNSRRVSATTAGTAFAEQAREVLSRFNLAVAEARRADRIAPALRIGYHPLLAEERLEAFLAGLRERLSGLQVETADMPALRQAAALRTATLDIGIYLAAEDPRGLETESLVPEEPLVALLPEGARKAPGAPVRADDLRDETLVVLERSLDPALHDWLLHACETGGYRFRAVAEVASLGPREAILAVAGGLGIVLVPPWVAERVTVRSRVTAHPLDPAVRFPPTIVAWRPSPSAKLAPTIATIRTLAREIRSENHQDPAGIDLARYGT